MGFQVMRSKSSCYPQVMVSLPVQLFIAWRLKIISKSRVLPAIISFLAITAFCKLDRTLHIRLSCQPGSITVGGVATAVSVAIINEYAHFREFDAAALTWLGSSTAADIIITASLVYNLVRIIGRVLVWSSILVSRPNAQGSQRRTMSSTGLSGVSLFVVGRENIGLYQTKQ